MAGGSKGGRKGGGSGGSGGGLSGKNPKRQPRGLFMDSPKASVSMIRQSVRKQSGTTSRRLRKTENPY